MEKAELCSSSGTLSSATAASSSRTAEHQKAGPVDNEPDDLGVTNQAGGLMFSCLEIRDFSLACAQCFVVVSKG